MSETVNLSQALDTLQQHRRHMEAVLTIADAVKGMAGLEQATNEAQARLDNLRTEAAALAERLAVDKAEHEAERQRYAAEIQAAQAQQGAIIAELERRLAEADTNLQARAQDLVDIEAKIERARAKTAEILGS